MPSNKQTLQASMLVNRASVTDLVRKTGFLKHQVQAAVSGDAKITEGTYALLERACEAVAQDRRPKLSL